MLALSLKAGGVGLNLVPGVTVHLLHFTRTSSARGLAVPLELTTVPRTSSKVRGLDREARVVLDVVESFWERPFPGDHNYHYNYYNYVIGAAFLR